MDKSMEEIAFNLIRIVKAQGEALVLQYRAEGRCFKCGKVFLDPDLEFKMLTNPLTGEQRRSINCNICRPIILAEFKEVMAKKKGE